MYQQEVLIINKSGLHARPAVEFVRAASLFRSSVSIIYKEHTINAKSIINIIAGGIVNGSLVIIQAEGPDEIIAVETLAAMVESGIGETVF
jgi:phosphocarrier protein HPr